MRPVHSTVITRKPAFPWVVIMSIRVRRSSTQPSNKRYSSLIRCTVVWPKATLFVSVICVGLACVFLACGGGWHESFYPSLAEAEKDGAITRGWIPDFLPKSSRAIHEAHRIEHPRTWCAFEFLSADSESLRKNLKGVDLLPVTRVLSPGVSWWPAVLKGNLDVRKIHEAGFELYKVVIPDAGIPDRTEVLLFAIDWSGGRGFFYQTYSGAHE